MLTCMRVCVALGRSVGMCRSSQRGVGKWLQTLRQRSTILSTHVEVGIHSCTYISLCMCIDKGRACMTIECFPRCISVTVVDVSSTGSVWVCTVLPCGPCSSAVSCFLRSMVLAWCTRYRRRRHEHANAGSVVSEPPLGFSGMGRDAKRKAARDKRFTEKHGRKSLCEYVEARLPPSSGPVSKRGLYETAQTPLLTPCVSARACTSLRWPTSSSTSWSMATASAPPWRFTAR